MIRPHKNLDLRTCTIRVAGTLLTLLRQQEMIKVDVARDAVESAVGPDARHTFFHAVNLLYLLDAVHFDSSSDVLVFNAGGRP